MQNDTRLLLALAGCLFAIVTDAAAQQIPHGQSKPPGPALSPQEAVRRMTVPEGFQVEIVASEPDIVNPVAMTFDERGRAWITESLEYPRRSPGKGRDRVKVLEDTDGDGRMDKFTVFADGLNIPSGVAVGWGGVWVANAPDILFMQDTDGDGKADTIKVVLTGFGRTDTHELPNSLTWGPDGYLYGLNGVFNYSDVSYGKDNPNYKENQGSRPFTCAMFRINPRTWEFEVFAEGTSNPWGIAFNPVGDAFISACVIDHLWHIAENGYYHRQGGPYPPFTWKLGSIVKHKHQKAAYCGITYVDTDVYPAEYSDRLMMGNIHGNCVNVDVLEDRGSSYFARPNDDFLSANDAWFMPVVQKVGPDGCLWVLDWYDRYHCYQDANRDPKGIDRLKGRLYRVRYGQAPRAGTFDLAAESDDQLIARLGSGNVYFRDIAQRLLAERLASSDKPAVREQLRSLVLKNAAGGSQAAKTRMHALWALAGSGRLDQPFHARLLGHSDGTLRAWGVRIAGNMQDVSDGTADRVQDLCRDTNPRVLLQACAAINKIKKADTARGLFDALNSAGNDTTVPRVAWQNLHPHIGDDPEGFLARLGDDLATDSAEIMPRIVERVFAVPDVGPRQVAKLLTALIEADNIDESRRILIQLSERAQTGQLSEEELKDLRSSLEDPLRGLMLDERNVLAFDALCAALSLGFSENADRARTWFGSYEAGNNYRLRALAALIHVSEYDMADVLDAIESSDYSLDFKSQVIALLGRTRSEDLARELIEVYPTLHPELKPRVVELLTSRTAWSRRLMAAIDAKDISASDLNATQVRKLFANPDKELRRLVTKQWGQLRTERDPAREELIARMRRLIRTTKGDPHRGIPVYNKLCGQCHKLYGEGQEVGPDITLNGRNSFEQLLSNVFDPSLVIGNAYQGTTVVTDEGKVISGLLVEDSPQRVVLKVQGGKQEIISRDAIEEVKKSELSLMPEGIEKQLSEQEIVDLFAYLTLDKPPSDPGAKKLPGSGLIELRESKNARDFPSMIGTLLPGFRTDASGHDGVAILPNHEGRAAVRVHPITPTEPCVVAGRFLIPESGRTSLRLTAGRHPKGNWELVVRVNDQIVKKTPVTANTAPDSWRDVDIDLSAHAGRNVTISLEAHDFGRWYYEFAYYARAELVTQ